MNGHLLRALGLAVCLLPISIAADDYDWPSHDRDPGGQRFSPLKQITPKNVATLEKAWTVDTGRAEHPGHSARRGRQDVRRRGQERARAGAGDGKGALAVHRARFGEPSRRRLLARRRDDAATALQRRGRSAAWPWTRRRASRRPDFGEGGYVDLKAEHPWRRRRPVQPRLAADRLQGHRHHRRQQRRTVAQLRALRRHPRLGRPHGQAALVVPHRAACRGARGGDVGRRELEEPLGHEHVVVLHRRCRARARLRPARIARRRTTTAATARARTSTATRSWPSTRAPAG